MKSILKSITRLFNAVFSASQGYQFKLILIGVGGIFIVIISMLFVYFSKNMIDIATGATEGDLFTSSVIIVLLLVMQIFMQCFTRWNSTKLNALLTNSLRNKYFDRLLTGDWIQSEKFRTGDMQLRLINDINDMASLIVYTIPGIIISFFELCIAFFFLYFLNPFLAITICIITPCFLIFSKAYFRKIRSITNNIKEYEGKLSTMINESFLNRNIIKSFDFREIQNNNFNFLQHRKLGFIFQKNNYSMLSYMLVSFCFGSGYLIAFIWGAHRISLGLISFGTMTAFLQLANRIQAPALDLLNTIPIIINTVTSIDRLNEIENLKPENNCVSKPLGSSLTLELDNVNFGYNQEKQVINNLSLKFTPGTISALVGESGTGKTTLIRLLLGLIKPDSGKLLFKTVTGESVEISEDTRANFVYVPQGNTLFGTSIRENILLGNPYATDDQIREAVVNAAAEFIYSLPDGLDTVLSENGSGVSQGQAQRIAIARAFLRPGSVILLDEATSALDHETEDIVLQRLSENKTEKTIIFISHNPKIKNYADVVFEM